MCHRCARTCSGYQGSVAGGIKADQVCWLVPPGVLTCSPFEERILHSWMGGLVSGAEEGGFKKL